MEGPVAQRACVWRHFTTLTRITGIFTAIVIWVVALNLVNVDADKRIAVYLIICAMVVSFLEVTFLLNRCVCCSDGSFLLTLWKYVMAIDNWKKFLLYAGLSILCFLHPNKLWQAALVGVLLNLTALLYLIRTVRTKNEKTPYKYKQLEVH